MSEDPSQISVLLTRIADGDRQAFGDLMPKVYAELRTLADHHMRREASDHSLQPTELVNELYMRLVGSEPVEWKGHVHFMAIASRAMRQILVDHARAKRAKKRGDGARAVPISESLLVGGSLNVELLDLESALEELGQTEGRAVQVVELLFFGGLSAREAAEVIGVTPRTVERDWRFARAWLYERLTG